MRFSNQMPYLAPLLPSSTYQGLRFTGLEHGLLVWSPGVSPFYAPIPTSQPTRASGPKLISAVRFINPRDLSSSLDRRSTTQLLKSMQKCQLKMTRVAVSKLISAVRFINPRDLSSSLDRRSTTQLLS